jgi:hypothetical protein
MFDFLLWIKWLVLGMLNVLGSCNVVLSSVLINLATLYPGLFVQLTIGRIGTLGLCNFTVPCICGMVY